MYRVPSSVVRRSYIPALFACIALVLGAQSAHAAGSVEGFDGTRTAISNDTVLVTTDAGTKLAPVRAGETAKGAAQRVAQRSGVRSVRPNHIARISGKYDSWSPNDPGSGTVAGGWKTLQWNFAGTWGVNALPAWRKMLSLKRSGGRGVTVAVIDTGVAYKTRGSIKGSPDLRGVKVRRPYDFIGRDKFPQDRNGHGTHVASTIFERTNNGVGVTGLAYNATMMPIRALDSRGYGDEFAVAKAIRYAAKYRASVINLSVEFDVKLSSSDLPVLVSAMRYAKRRGSLIVAASGNQSANSVAMPARSGYVVGVGATTVDGCLADFSDYGSGLNLVAPGGGNDSIDIDISEGSTDKKNCRYPSPAKPIFQMTFVGDPNVFYLPGIYQGTSMAAPHVSATAALVIASGVIGKRPSPDKIKQRLQKTATDLGATGFDRRYGHGLLNAGAAVGATAVVKPPATGPTGPTSG
jgi:serine protease